MLGWGLTVYTPQQTTYVSLHSLLARSPQQHRDVQQELITLIQDFLKDVPKNERATFDRFFADDIVYTRGTGQVITKKDILADTGRSTTAGGNATYDGEDF